MTTDPGPAGELREAAKGLRELAEAAKALTEDGHGEWFLWGVVQETTWQDWPEPQPVLDDGPFGTGETVMSDGRYEPTGQAFVSHPRWTHDREESWHEAEFIAGPVPEALARFIASMHPAVALAVADLLEQIAAEAEVFLHPDGNCDRCNLWFGDADNTEADAVCTCWDDALKVARAYLGGEIR